MGLKRKRSDSAFSPSSATSTAQSDASSPSPCDSGSYQSHRDAMMQDAFGDACDLDQWAMDVATSDMPSYLNSRTRKRYRNNRPSDEVVYGTASLETCNFSIAD